MIVPWNPPRNLTFRGPSQPGIERFDPGTPGHLGRGLNPQRSSGLLPTSTPLELDTSVAHRDQSTQCMLLTIRRFLPTDLFL